MALFTVHVPEAVTDRVARADRTVFVREGFAVSGLVLGWLYLVRHRLWLSALVWLMVVAVLAAIWSLLALPMGPLVLLIALMHVFVGVEGNDLRRWALARRHYRFADIVSGGARAEAEYAFFVRQPEAPSSRTPITPRFVQQDLTPSVIGLFPDGTVS